MPFPSTIYTTDWRDMFADFRAQGGVKGNVAWRQIQERLSRGADCCAPDNARVDALQEALRDFTLPKQK
jgi:hypothetical protein